MFTLFTLACTEMANSFNDKQRLTIFNGLAIFNQDLFHGSSNLGLDFVQQFHRLDDAQRVTWFDCLA